MDAYQEELTLARSLARLAGEGLKAARGTEDVLKRPHGGTYLDVTTSADLASEKLVIEAIEAAYPGDHILSEETRSSEETAHARLWILDPLDGTTNFVKGLDAYGVSIALLVEGVVVMAVNYLPETGDEYYAIRGAGMHRNGERLALASPEDSLEESLVSVGFPHKRDQRVLEEAFILYRDILAASSDLRRSASAAYDTCLLARGLTGAYLTPDIKPWDIVAMSLFVEEQGGVVTDLSGGPLDLFRCTGEGLFSVAILCAKNRGIHDALVRIARKHA